jgi:DNA-binding LacI/PurR family transcriptional regulator
MGHRRFLWVSADTTLPNRFVERERQMLKAIASKGCQCEFCYFPAPSKPVDFYEFNLIETTRAHVLKRLEKPFDFTAVMCFSDIIAIGAHRAIVQSLKIPSDLSLTGYDALFHEYVTPRLTTVDHKLFDMGMEAGNVMMKMLNGGKHAIRNMQNAIALIQPELIIGNSVRSISL